jgi:hypothetical protein
VDGSFDDEAGVEIDGQGRPAPDAVEKDYGITVTDYGRITVTPY